MLPILTVTCASEYFMSNVYKCKKGYSPKIYFVLWILFATVYALIIHLNLGSIIMTIYGVGAVQLLSIFYERKSYKIFFTFFFYLYLMIVDIISIPATSILFGVNTSEVVSNENIRIYTPIISAIITFGSLYFITKALAENKNTRSERKINVLFSIVIIAEGTMMVYGIFLATDNLIGDKFFILTLLFFLAFDVMGIYLYRLLNIENQLQKELALSKQKYEMEYEHFRLLGEGYDKSRKLLHDIKNHLIAIKGLEDSTSYVEELTGKIDKVGYKFKCSNRILTILISEKIAKAEEDNIAFITHVEDLDFDFISDLDWVTILGNVIDNAIEACRRNISGERKIELFIHKYKKMLVIRLENSLQEKPLQGENGLQSTKEGHMGVGLSNVKETLAKYDGEIKIDYDEKRFKIGIIIPVE